MKPAEPDDSDEFAVRLEWDEPAPAKGQHPDDAVFVSAAEPPPPEAVDAPGATGDVVRPAGPTGPLLPALMGRLETVHGSITSLGMRIDALGQSITTSGTAIADQLNEYGETVAQLARAQGEALDEYRHGNERSVSELRRSLTASDELNRRLSERVDELVSDTASLTEMIHSLDPGAVQRQDASSSTAVADLLTLGEELSRELVALREDVVLLKRRLGVRSRSAPTTAPALDEGKLAERVAERVATSIPTPALHEDDIDRIVAALGSHLERTFEVVPDHEVAPDRKAPPSKAKPAAAKNAAPASRRRS
ncbi:MAG: hypothetical protein QOD92_1678 [Acidimicrobiaceae bacterium]|jgi:uncharacterized membrane protein YccC